MRILFVAMAHSIHTARWVNQLKNQKWDIHVFDAMEAGLIPELTGVTAHVFYRPRRNQCNVSRVHYTARFPLVAGFMRHRFPALSRRIFHPRVDTLTELIRSLNPDIIHSLEMQNESYPLLEVRRRLGGEFPMPWIYSSWGSDLYLFGSKPEHEIRVKEVLGACDYYIADCQRDVQLSAKLGFAGEVLGVFPGTGGFDVLSMRKRMKSGPISTRNVIALKGFQGWAGRAIVALKALELCADALRNYTVVVYGADSQLGYAARNFSRTTGVNIEILPRATTNLEMVITLFGSARLAIGVSISDGTPISMLEAMVMGAFPIQSDTISTAEWITDGENGLLVPPEDPEVIATAVRRALSDDTLVDHAAELNTMLARQRLEQSIIRPKVVALYERVAAQGASKKRLMS